MNIFFIGVMLMIFATLALLLPPLLRRQVPSVQGVSRDHLNLSLLRGQLQELDADLQAGRIDAATHSEARQELQVRVMEEVRPHSAFVAGGDSRWAGIVTGIAIPVVAACTYLLAGTPAALVPADMEKHELASSEVESMVAGLAERLKQKPDNPEGWQMLIRSYNVLGRFREASDAYARLVKLVPGDARIYSDYADTLGMAQGKTLIGEPEALIAKALSLEPDNLKALALSGSVAFEKGEFSKAVVAWERILQVAPADSDVARTTMESIGHAKRLMKEQGGKTIGKGS
jgi:cytochrome c-type biogenesis protein CcmH